MSRQDPEPRGAKAFAPLRRTSFGPSHRGRAPRDAQAATAPHDASDSQSHHEDSVSLENPLNDQPAPASRPPPPSYQLVVARIHIRRSLPSYHRHVGRSYTEYDLPPPPPYDSCAASSHSRPLSKTPHPPSYNSSRHDPDAGRSGFEKFYRATVRADLRRELSLDSSEMQRSTTSTNPHRVHAQDQTPVSYHDQSEGLNHNFGHLQPQRSGRICVDEYYCIQHPAIQYNIHDWSELLRRREAEFTAMGT